ncbi:alkaline ceramidase 3-like [Patiria miniata]|uniref:Alkaline ceramidase n=1 Tax=Patiria miniata TaxID=46514 RepID=A0A913ZFI8_PATMI|nr:alkaline ceramidase 3-like [Patiria miniata]
MAPASAEFVGAWGKPTSTLDWCEENYLASPYIAELWNSLSCFVIMGIPIVMLFSLSRRKVETRFYIGCWCFLAVGVGSLAFHMTLLYETQLMDELSMIFGGCVLVYLFYSDDYKPNYHNLPLVVFLLLYAVSVSCIYIITQQPIFHQVAFALQVITISLRGSYCYRLNKQSYSGKLLVLSIVLYLLGFLLWLVDQGFCADLRSVRAFLPSPLDGLLQFHAWWHTLSALGSQCLFAFCCHSRLMFLKRNPQIWTLGCLPLITLDAKENGHIQ